MIVFEKRTSLMYIIHIHSTIKQLIQQKRLKGKMFLCINNHNVH